LAVDRISIDGTLLTNLPDLRYYVYNKPRFMLCDKTVAGDTRRTIFEAVPSGNELAVVGRLDFESEGLVILTNDGELVNKLTHPRYEHEKEYRVLLSSKPDAGQLEIWKRGIVLEDGYRTAPVKVRIESQVGKGVWLRVVMKEGRKRQIRETAKLLGLYVVRILRIRIGPISLGNLKTGEFRELTKEEVNELKGGSGATRKVPENALRKERADETMPALHFSCHLGYWQLALKFSHPCSGQGGFFIFLRRKSFNFSPVVAMTGEFSKFNSAFHW